MTVFWFRRDLRLDDNVGLYQALQSGQPVLPVFIFDTDILSGLPRDDARVTFIHRLLSDIQERLLQSGRSLAVFHGKPEDVFDRLLREHPEITSVYANHDYEPYARQRDATIGRLVQAHGKAWVTFKDQVVYEKSEVSKSDGTPYVVYTPFSNRWKELLRRDGLGSYLSQSHPDRFAPHDYPFLSLRDIGFTPSDIPVPEPDLSPDLIDHYAETRDFPALDATSHLGPYLRFGSVSVREMVRRALSSDHPTFLNELIWREFFMQILWHFPHTATRAFRPAYDRIPWRHDERDFDTWCAGKTGYPLVDAGMRQLNQTGRMHNRVRMVAASFLCKHLLLDWRLGEAYFAEKLLDYDQASNVGNWQWAAGSGVDAAPYFRIFNPGEQLRKFDRNLHYVRRWLPEFGTEAYPQPMVVHREARERALAVYRKGLEDF